MKNNIILILRFNIAQLTLLIAISFNFVNSYTDEIFLQPIAQHKKPIVALKSKTKIKPKKSKKIEPISSKKIFPKAKPAQVVIAQQITPVQPIVQPVAPTTSPIEPITTTPTVVVPIATKPTVIPTPMQTQAVIPVQPTSSSVTSPQVQPTSNLAKPAAPIAIAIFNNTTDSITINNINLFPGSSFYNPNLSTTTQCAIYTKPIVITDYSINTSSTLPIILKSGTSWRGGYACDSNNTYVSGIIDYTVTNSGTGYKTEYVTPLFSVNNQNEISISFNSYYGIESDKIKIFGQDPKSLSTCVAANNCGQPAKCSSNDPATDNGKCGCLNYPDSKAYTGSLCSLDWSQNNPELPLPPAKLTPDQAKQDCSRQGGIYVPVYDTSGWAGTYMERGDANNKGGVFVTESNGEKNHIKGNICCNNPGHVTTNFANAMQNRGGGTGQNCAELTCMNTSNPCGVLDVANDTCTCMQVAKDYN